MHISIYKYVFKDVNIYVKASLNLKKISFVYIAKTNFLYNLPFSVVKRRFLTRKFKKLLKVSFLSCTILFFFIDSAKNKQNINH